MSSSIKNSVLNKVVVLVVVSLTLQSCFVAKDYQRPEIEETQNLYRTDQLPADSLSMAEVSWKTIFTDPFLTKYIEEGIQNNIDINGLNYSFKNRKIHIKIWVKDYEKNKEFVQELPISLLTYLDDIIAKIPMHRYGNKTNKFQNKSNISVRYTKIIPE